MMPHLAGPTPRIRYVLTPTALDAVVGGVFPPEDAPLIRDVAVRIANRAFPEVWAEWQRLFEREIHELLHGSPSATAPRGLLYGRSVVDSLLAAPGMR
jgi:hypothetical protein